MCEKKKKLFNAKNKLAEIYTIFNKYLEINQIKIN